MKDKHALHFIPLPDASQLLQLLAYNAAGACCLKSILHFNVIKPGSGLKL
jgi:hypothetical protein